MGTITERLKANGKPSFTFQIRKEKNGKVILNLVETFASEQAAKSWLKRREDALKKPGDLERAVKAKTRKSVADCIGDYIDASPDVFGKSKSQMLSYFQRLDCGGFAIEDLSAQDFVKLAMELLSGIQARPTESEKEAPSHYTLRPRKPQTVNGYMVTLGTLIRWQEQPTASALRGPKTRLHLSKGMTMDELTEREVHELVLDVLVHGITSNECMRASERPNLCSLIRATGKVTAAVAHEYYHCLHVDRPWDRLCLIEHRDTDTDIQHARFYSTEGCCAMNAAASAEIDLCAQAALLVENHTPDYLLLHTSFADTPGHTFGGDSKEYRYQVWMIDNALSKTIPAWREMGYEVMATADHGMNAEHHHGGMEKIMREVPFYYFGEADGPEEGTDLSQLALAATILNRMGVAPAAAFRESFL